MSPTPDPMQNVRTRVATIMKVMIIAGWGSMAVGFASVVTAGHMSSSSLVAFASALLCLSGVLLIVFRHMKNWEVEGDLTLSGKETALVFTLAGACILFLVLAVLLQ